MEHTQQYRRIGAALLVLVVPVTALVFSRAMFNIFHAPKAAAAVAVAWVLLALGVGAGVARERVGVPRDATVLTAVVFVAMMGVALVVSGATGRALIGGSTAHSGFVLYASCVVLFVMSAALLDESSVTRLLVAVAITAVPVIAYAAVQVLGVDPLRWRSVTGGPQVYATFGNANFMSGWLGVAAVAAAGLAAGVVSSPLWRTASGVVAAAALLMTWLSGSVQGSAAGAAGLLALGVIHVSPGTWRQRSVRAAAVVVTVAVFAAGGVVLGSAGARRSLETRTGKWHAAVAMAADRPMAGVGPDLFVDWYHAYRPQYDASARGLQQTADVAHSVPLQLLAGGGFPLVISYAAFVLLVGRRLVKGLRASMGRRRTLLGTVGGAWVAYLVQSVVSIDVAPLAVLHWILAGAIVGLGTAPRQWPQAGDRPRHVWGDRVALPVAALVALPGLVLCGAFVRAEIDAGVGARAAIVGRDRVLEPAFDRALQLNPWEARYAVMLARRRADRGDLSGAAAAYEVALRRQPRGIIYVVEAARVEDRLDRHDRATDLYSHALSLDPSSPDLLTEVARHHASHGRVDPARALLTQALQRRPRFPPAVREMRLLEP